MTFLPPIYTSTSPKQIMSENLKSSTLTTTNYRILITGPNKSTVYSKDVSNRPEDDRKGGDGFDSLSKLGTKNKKENRGEATDSGDYEVSPRLMCDRSENAILSVIQKQPDF